MATGDMTPAEAAMAWQERSIEHARHAEVLEKLKDIHTLLVALARHAGKESDDAA